jgi:hypothetical protein
MKDLFLLAAALQEASQAARELTLLQAHQLTDLVPAYEQKLDDCLRRVHRLIEGRSA